jgi:hypothetical protein
MKAIKGGVATVKSQNAGVNGPKGRVLGGGSPKDTSGGCDLGAAATNCVGGKPHLTRAESPNAKGASRNQ